MSLTNATIKHNESALINAGVQAGLLPAERINDLVNISRRQKLPLLDLVKFEWRLPLRILYQLWAESLNLQFVALIDEKPDTESIKKFSSNLIRRKMAVPILSNDNNSSNLSNSVTKIVCMDPEDKTWIDHYKKILSDFEIKVAEPESIKRFIALHLPGSSLNNQQEKTDAVLLLENIFVESFLRRASDIHIESLKEGIRIRLRVDGKLQAYGTMLDKNTGLSLISRIKILSGMDIAENRAPQDGGFAYEFLQAPLESIEVRVASLPGYRGERITIRILAAGTESLSLEDLGMPKDQLTLFRRLIRQSHGMLLITGPTGSGKSTTLYSALRVINRDDINVLTVEDPVESDIHGITQVNVNNKTSFSGSLRSFLRHDPDVIMVGEIRDRDTADVALKASLTGHFVFSTLHTNTACGAVMRLGDIGCDAFMIGSTLRAVIAQRLVRRLCQKCKRGKIVNEEVATLLSLDKNCTIYRPKGCAMCQGSGYSGRVGLYEFLWIDQELADFISEDPTELELMNKAGNRLYRIKDDARQKIIDGLIAFDDVEPLLGIY